MDAKCHQCDKSADDVVLRKCPICHKHFCEEHSHVWSGRSFCSRGCADQFFFDDED